MTSSEQLLRSALREKGIDFSEDLPTAKYSTFRIGGRADLAVFPKTEAEFFYLRSLLLEASLPVAIVGGGSNLLFPDADFHGVLLFTTALVGIRALDETTLAVSAGTRLSALSRYLLEHSLSGGEFLYGIPGTVGGATVMNAGAYGGEMKDLLRSSVAVDLRDPIPKTLSLSEHDYSYRESIYLKSPTLLSLSAILQFLPGKREAIESRMNELLARRREKQPLELPSAGSVFRRPAGAYAGKLIEDCGLKGYRIGGAAVSEKHAGFIVNLGGATEQNVRALITHIRETVLKETGYFLKCEIRTLMGEEL